MSGTSGSARFVGRTRELAELAAAFDAARAGHAVGVLLGGEAGVGKTRLASEFAGQVAADGTRTLVGQCVELGNDGLPYAPIAGALRALVAELGADTVLELAGPGRDALSVLLPELGLPRPAESDGRGRLFEVITVLLERLAVQQPLVLVIEDLHWADGSTRDLLRFAVRALVRSPILLVLTYRTDEITRTHALRPFLAEFDRLANVHRVDVPRLSECEVAEQLEGLLGQRPPAAVVTRVAARSEGIPFFVEELATAETDADQDRPMPESLRDLLLVRVDRLSPGARQLLRVLAAAGSRASHELLSLVADVDDGALDERLQEAVSANVIRVVGDSYVFRHALLREALHDDLLPGEHARLHLRYADALERRPGLVGPPSASMEIAHHLQSAHELPRAFRAYLDAADEAGEAVAFREAQLALERALELWHLIPDPVAVSGGDHAALLSRAAAAAADAGESERSLAMVESALTDGAVAADPVRHADLLFRRAILLSDLGRDGGLQALRQALQLITGLPESHTLAHVLQKLGGELMMWGQFPEAADAAQEAAEVARRVGARGSQFRAYNVLGPVLVALGRTDEGLAALATARMLAAVSPRLSAGYHINASDVLHLLGRYREAADTAIAGIESARAGGVVRTLGAMMTGNAAEPLLALGEWDRAEQMVAQGLELEPPLRHLLHLLRLRATIRLWRGDLDGAAGTIERLRELMRGRSPTPQYTIPLAATTAELALARGEPAAAWRDVEAELAHGARVPGYDLPLLATGAWALGELARSPGDPAAADVVAAGTALVRARLAPVADWGPGPSWQLLIEAELADGTEGAEGAGRRLGLDVDRWRAVLASEALPARIPPYAGYRLATALLAAGDRAGAHDQLRAARERAQTLGAGLLTGWIDDLSSRARLTVRDDGRAPTPTAGLTRREREVLELVARGASNRQIGQALFISTKTASVHVSNILAKLGVAGRGEAAAYARDTGLLEPAHG